MQTKSIVMCGVGGQGIVLASDVLSGALFKTGYDVKKNEIHGMSQREGAVSSFIRYGDKVYSPVVSPGEADFLIGFEKLEALRNKFYLIQDGYAVINSFEIPPTPVIMGTAEYPKEIEKNFSDVTKNVKMVNALEAVRPLGNVKAVNTLILGVISKEIPEISLDCWKKAIESFVKPNFVELNWKAFELGRNLE